MTAMLMIVMALLALFLILLVLVQRGRGGGLAGALGGMGGQSAFGTKAGDLFTRDHDRRRPRSGSWSACSRVKYLTARR